MGAEKELDVVWVRENGETIEVGEMNEWHLRGALRQMITAVAHGDIAAARSHILGAA